MLPNPEFRPVNAAQIFCTGRNESPERPRRVCFDLPNEDQVSLQFTYPTSMKSLDLPDCLWIK
jgi:hypothetical protein